MNLVERANCRVGDSILVLGLHMGGKNSSRRYNEKYSRLKRTDSMESKLDQSLAQATTGWNGEVLSWNKDLVLYAVYEAPGFEEWQKFRVSLKGQSTGMKLVRLQQYLVEKLHLSAKQVEYKRCRVDNYIGALVRGGQLDSKLRIVK